MTDIRICAMCNKKKTKRNRKLCTTCVTSVRRYRNKIAAIQLMGGKCNRCGWSGNMAGFEFHHKNDDKEFAISKISNRSWPRVKEELEKCELLCSTCHRIEHCKFKNRIDFLKDYISNDKDIDDLICEYLGQPKRTKPIKKSQKCKSSKCSNVVYEPRKYCSYKCSRQDHRKVDRPSKEILKIDLDNLSYRAIGRKYGVSDNTIRKWAKSYNLIGV